MTEIDDARRCEAIALVEDFVRKHSGTFKKDEIWMRLSNRITYRDFCAAFDFLLGAGRIAVDAEGKVGWVWGPELVLRYLMKRHAHLLIRECDDV